MFIKNVCRKHSGFILEKYAEELEKKADFLAYYWEKDCCTKIDKSDMTKTICQIAISGSTANMRQ